MKRRLKKDRSDGIAVMVAYAALQILPAVSLGDVPVFLDSLAYHLALVGIVYILVYLAAKSKKDGLGGLVAYFRAFNISKALGLCFLMPSVVFVYRLVQDLHGTLIFPSPFITPLVVHFLFVIGFMIALIFYKMFKKKPDIRKLGLNTFRLDGYFAQVKGGPAGVVLSFSGITYLAFFYLTLSVFMTPFWVEKTEGQVVSVERHAFVIASKYGGARKGHFDVVTLQKADHTMSAYGVADADAVKPGQQVVIQHHVLDYFFRPAAAIEIVR